MQADSTNDYKNASPPTDKPPYGKTSNDAVVPSLPENSTEGVPSESKGGYAKTSYSA